MEIRAEIIEIAAAAKQAVEYLSEASSKAKNEALEAIAAELTKRSLLILKANAKDVECAKKGKKSKAFIERLALTKNRIKKMSDDVRSIIALGDPVGEIIKLWKRPNGLMIGKMRVPLGVIGIIYESRPNVTSDCAALCLKSGNAVILRGGKESFNSNKAIYKAICAALEKSGFPNGCVSFIPTVDREAVSVMLGLADYIDLIIPRGGEALIRSVVEMSKIPVIKHYKGICHTYVDEHADMAMAEEIAFNAKVHSPSTCNAMECLLVHIAVAKEFLPKCVKRLQKAGVEIRGCSRTMAICPGIKKVSEEDFATEYLDLMLSVKIVDSLEEAAAHIARYGSKHSDAIVTNNFQNGMKFLKKVDAACVYLNASTRFTDGNEFGLGAEIGVSTDKLHARGPMGLEELTTYKYIIMGNGQIRT
ncbi:MAG: glutamate-5-semialdehyde dehydrogenase [Candidatus Omnitrophica bacterium]|nr:glutamate-5-semialdehyde dehydrogenase [Candidatus Omnitrophota bacterium]MBU4479625.1 glutamate-5-semialdehyde dehydrogenase [Candidatus Omnitrophota bacterium]MCG2703705.1 glutamate-5-semialdehyde dehydrogenase [Candidatus Omnitrophota bacterium]